MLLTDNSINLLKHLNKNIPSEEIFFFEKSNEIFLQFFSYFKHSANYISSINLKDHLIVNQKILSKDDIPLSENSTIYF